MLSIEAARMQRDSGFSAEDIGSRESCVTQSQRFFETLCARMHPFLTLPSTYENASQSVPQCQTSGGVMSARLPGGMIAHVFYSIRIALEHCRLLPHPS
jgi:hypothetical protein